jgi:hypothetical protein
MIDEILARAVAYEGDALIAWTPEAVALRMIEAASVFARTPAKIGPSRFKTAWPAIVITAQDLVDEETQQRLLRFPHLVGDWESHIDPPTKRHISREKQAEWNRPSAPTHEEYSRAEEALRWPALFLGDRPLLADAITLWALCMGTNASLRATLRRRVKDADAKMRAIGASRRQDAIPGKNFNRDRLNYRRREAAELICLALSKAGIALREAADDISADADE